MNIRPFEGEKQCQEKIQIHESIHKLENLEYSTFLLMLHDSVWTLKNKQFFVFYAHMLPGFFLSVCSF